MENYRYELIPSPCYLLEEELLEKNLKLLKHVQDESEAKILLALKGFANYETFDLVGKYLHGITASGLHEAKLGYEKMGKEVHTYSPAFKDDEIDEILEISNHIVFNSISQWKRFKGKAIGKASCGLRVNPEFSSVEVDLYNPCAPYSRLGITKEQFDLDNGKDYLDGIEGLHFHGLCEQNVDALEGLLKSFEEKFGDLIPQMKWINFGGGHHITRDDYDVDSLINLIKEFKQKYDNIEVYLEPGEAVGWRTGPLISTVLDIVHNGVDIAILDTSAEAHMPDTLAMPYRPDVRFSGEANEKNHTYRLAGNTCLAGDIIGDYSFDKKLNIGDKIIFEDMMHYTMVKNTTFNGIKLPAFAILKKDGSIDIKKVFGYEDYKNRL